MSQNRQFSLQAQGNSNALNGPFQNGHQSLISQQSQNMVAGAIAGAGQLQSQSAQGASQNHSGTKINHSMSKTQLKKQVVQFYW